MANYGTYASLTDIRSALAYAATETADDTRLRQVLEAVSHHIDDYCRRFFGARTETRTLTATETQRLLLDQDLLSITTLKTDSDGDWDYDDTWTTSDYHLAPFNSFPKWEIRTKSGGSYAFSTQEEGVQIAGLWGYGDGDSATPYTASGATVTVGTTSGTSVTASSGTPFSAGNTVLAGTEQMYIQSISTNTLTVVRGVNGTTAAIQAGATAYIYRYPAPVVEAAIILASRIFRRKDSPLGVTGAADLGTVYVGRVDWDVERLLMPYRLWEVK